MNTITRLRRSDIDSPNNGISPTDLGNPPHDRGQIGLVEIQPVFPGVTTDLIIA
jgi:hypothetical protein